MNESSFDITYSDLNPTLFYAGKRTVTDVGKTHTHDAQELLIVLYGTLPVSINNKIINVNAGDIINVPQNTPHHTLASAPEDPAVIFFTSFSDFHFRGMDPNTILFPGGATVLHTDGLVRQDMVNLCLKMVAERYNNQVGQYFMQKAYLTQLLLMIIRQFSDVRYNDQNDSYAFETHHKAYVVNEIRKYLSNHYADKISLDLIAKNMYLSSAYISKIFKEETGEAPINYLIKLRLERARAQLEANSRESVKAISGSVGYDDVYYFSKLFKKYYGISPANYRASRSAAKQTG